MRIEDPIMELLLWAYLGTGSRQILCTVLVLADVPTPDIHVP